MQRLFGLATPIAKLFECLATVRKQIAQVETLVVLRVFRNRMRIAIRYDYTYTFHTV
jgi:hypothetical protein